MFTRKQQQQRKEKPSKSENWKLIQFIPSLFFLFFLRSSLDTPVAEKRDHNKESKDKKKKQVPKPQFFPSQNECSPLSCRSLTMKRAFGFICSLSHTPNLFFFFFF
jgi:hypothetical protein